MTGREFYMLTMLLEESGLADSSTKEEKEKNEKVAKSETPQGGGGYPPGVRILADDYHGWDSWD